MNELNKASDTTDTFAQLQEMSDTIVVPEPLETNDPSIEFAENFIAEAEAADRVNSTTKKIPNRIANLFGTGSMAFKNPVDSEIN